MVRVLVVEDEANIRDMIALNLRHAGMEVVEAESAEAALPLLAQKPGCDAAILDVMLPGMNGFSLCETIRRTDQQIGIIILSAKGQEQDKIRGLSIGADDYMTKPFSVSELLARVEALCRRVIRTKEADSNGNTPLGTLTSGEFVLDENRRVLLKAGQPIELTQVEFQIMELFFRNPGTALVRENAGTVHMRGQLAQASLFGSAAQNVILDNSILNARFTQLAAQLGVIGHGDAAVIDQYAGSGIFHLFCQSSNLLLFLFQNISVRQNVSPPKVI